jgi:hypothetical protein
MTACAKSEPPPRFAPPTPNRTDSDADVRTEAVEDTDAVLAPGQPVAATTPMEPAPATPAAPLVDDALCRSACENALTVTLAELPEATIASMRDELTRALRDDCPARCVAKASLESARCIANAKTALALASCP